MGNDTEGAADSGAECAEYIERMCAELGRIADVNGMPVLAYLLEMAREEAGLARNASRVSLRPGEPSGGRVPRTGHTAVRR
jgi:hypothetical protein